MAFEQLTRWFREARNALVGGDSNIDSSLGALDTALADVGTATVWQTAAVEFALGMVGRAFFLAETNPPVPAISPMIRSMIARQTIARGNAVFQIIVNRRTGRTTLLPVSRYEISGGVDPDTWRYDIELESPTGGVVQRNVPSSGMVHVPYMPNPERPWQGVSPLIRAGLTAQQLAAIERSLRDDASIPTGNIMPMPDGVSDLGKKQVTNALTNGKAGISPVETTSGGFGQGGGAAPKKDWEQTRFGPMTPETSIELREKTALQVLSALGIPPALYTSQGAALRESYRHFFTNTVEPLGELIAAELREKLEEPVVFHFPEIIKSDIAARARGFGSLKQAGMTDADARRTVGFLPGVEAPPALPTT